MHTLTYAIRVKDIMRQFNNAAATQVKKEWFVRTVNTAVDLMLSDGYSDWLENQALIADESGLDHTHWQDLARHIENIRRRVVNKLYRECLSRGQWFDDSFFIDSWGLLTPAKLRVGDSVLDPDLNMGLIGNISYTLIGRSYDYQTIDLLALVVYPDGESIAWLASNLTYVYTYPKPTQ